MPDIEPVYTVCQRKIKIMLKKKKTLKNVPMPAAENAQKFGGKILEIPKQFSRVTASTNSHGIGKKPARPPCGLE